MAESRTENNKRIAKNTFFLYCRTLLTMLITLYTSRVILQTLGVSDYGIYNVVGGMVSMLSVLTSSLSSSISRFTTFELGSGNTEKLKRVFCTSINIQIGISILIVLAGEIIGVWFLNNKLQIPTDRLYAAHWVLQCTLASFVVRLISVPYNASIIAHEKMSAFAYISIIDVTLKLIIVYLLYISPIDKLITYSILLVIEGLMIRSIYSIYCRRHFPECRFSFVFDKKIIKDMTGFAGWAVFNNSAYVFNNQGVNMVLNLFFGVTVNAARAIASQIESAITRFVNDFSTALNPQITKSYAAGQKNDMYKLVCQGAKFSYFLAFILALPLLLETPFVLKLWLNIVPDYTVVFFRLTMVVTLIQILGHTGYVACMATGNIKKYSLIITSVIGLDFPLTWLAFKLGAPVEYTYYIYGTLYLLTLFVRLPLMKKLTGFPPTMFLRSVIARVIIVTILSIILPFFIQKQLQPGFLRFIIVSLTCIASCAVIIASIGLNNNEKVFLKGKIKSLKKNR